METASQETTYSRYLSAYRHFAEKVDDPPAKGIPREFVVWAYRLFLDREPEDPGVVDDLASSIDQSAALRALFMASNEYRAKSGGGMTGSDPTDAPRTVIERIADREALEAFFEHVQATWTRLGVDEPHWSVLSAEQFRQSNIQGHLASFKDSGRREVEGLISCLHRNAVPVPKLRTCLEYGCGVGRVTRWLAASFREVVGCDISASHIEHAALYLNQEECRNVTFKHVSNMADIENLPQTDFFYSVIVLQHNPPPIIELILNGLLDALNVGGFGYFQLPTYASGYSFQVQEYLRGLHESDDANKIEMHVLPVATVFEIVRQRGCVVVDMLRDDWAGQGYESHSFLVHRPIRQILE